MVNWLSVVSLLFMASIYELPIISIDFVLAFHQSDLDVDIFMDIPLVMEFVGNREEWVLNLNKSLYGINQASVYLFHLLKTGLENRG